MIRLVLVGIVGALLVLAGSLPLSQAADPEPEIDLTLSGGRAFTNSIGMEFVLIPAGTFVMGSPDTDTKADKDERPAHRVTISHPFYLGNTK